MEIRKGRGETDRSSDVNKIAACGSGAKHYTQLARRTCDLMGTRSVIYVLLLTWDAIIPYAHYLLHVYVQLNNFYDASIRDKMREFVGS